MKTIHKSVLIWHSAAEMFALVIDIERYPEFLPWCDCAQIIEPGHDRMMAKIGMAIGGLRHSFTTQNTHEIDRKVSMALVDGPFSQLNGCWEFTPIGDPSSPPACRVQFTLNYSFKSATLAKIVGPVFDKIAASLVDAFVKRADHVHGSLA